MAVIFDGRSFAQEKIKLLRDKVTKLRRKNITPKLVSIIVGDNPGGLFYANLKKKKAEGLGIDVEIKSFPADTRTSVLVHEITKLNSDFNIHGIMFQLPIGKDFSDEDVSLILNSIAPEKDVDALSDNSKFVAPTALAVLSILNESKLYTPCKTRSLKVAPCKVCVVGYTGFEGSGIHKLLTEQKAPKTGKPLYEVVGADSETRDLAGVTLDADIVVSATGVPDLIKADMVKPGTILIDVGSPKGDIEKKAYEKAVFVSPSPGGVGPVTIFFLFDNLLIIDN